MAYPDALLNLPTGPKENHTGHKMTSVYAGISGPQL
jgi:hypothetical protein